MSIQQYYQQNAKIYLNTCIVSLFLLSMVLMTCMLLSLKPPFALIAIPFCILVLHQFHHYLQYHKRAKAGDQIEKTKEMKKPDLFSQSHLLLTYVPAPAVTLLLFSPGGYLAGEIKEMKQRYWRWLIPDWIDYFVEKTFGVYDQYGHLNVMLKVKKEEIAVLHANGKAIAIFNLRTYTGQFLDTKISYTCKNDSSLITDVHMFREEQLVSRLQKGWMPVEWEKNFLVNTPVLSFELAADKRERLLALAVLISYYQYENH